MKRTGLITLGVAMAAVAAALLYTTLAREAAYRRLITEGETALASDQMFVAIEDFSGAIALKPDSMLGYLRRGEAYRRRGGGDLQTALRDLRMAAQLDPTALKPQEELGDVNFALERFARAAESYDAYLKLDDRSSTVWYKLALSRFRLSDAGGAIPALLQTVALNDRFAEAFYLLGVCQGQLGQSAEAVKSLGRAVEVSPTASPTFLPARQEMVRLLLILKRDADAIRELEKLAAFGPTRPDHLIEAGVIYARLGRTDLALAELNRAAERDPADPRVYQALGQIWLDAAESRRDRVAMGMTQEQCDKRAIAALDRASRAPGATSQGLTLYGRALVLAGDPVAAQQAFEQAVQKAPIEPVAYRELALLAQRRGDLLTARDGLVRYLALNTDNAQVRDVPERIGDLCLRLDQAAEAARWLRQAADASGDDPATAGRLATMQLRAGDRDGAAATVERGLKKTPNSPELLALRRRAAGAGDQGQRPKIRESEGPKVGGRGTRDQGPGTRDQGPRPDPVAPGAWPTPGG
jgi:tetratricopeptide (TPR) repeat protein